MKNVAKLLLAAIPALLLVACTTTGDKAGEKEGMPSDAAAPGAETTTPGIAAPDRGGFQGHPLDDPTSLLAKRVVYWFDNRAEGYPVRGQSAGSDGARSVRETRRAS